MVCCKCTWHWQSCSRDNRQMKTNCPSANTRLYQGITIVECLVYLSAFGVILGLSTAAFYQCMDNSIGLRRNVDDIVHALNAGERWREDVRTATAPPQLVQTDTGWTFTIQHKAGQVRYQFLTNAIVRQTLHDAPSTVVLGRVKWAQIIPQKRQYVFAWRLELELKPYRNVPRLQPRFSFQAVPTLSQSE